MEGLDTWLEPLEIYFKKRKNRRHKYVRCLCKCGNIKEVSYDSYKRRAVRSCGCYSTFKKKTKYGYFNRTQGCLNIMEVDGKIYYPLFNFYGYYTDIEGNIYSDKTKKILKHHINKKGYHQVSLSNYTDRSDKQIVHRLVADVFILNKGNFPQVNHIDGDKDNNHASNLEWCTNDYNMRHSWEIGLREPLKGKDIGTSKLSEQEVVGIYESEENSYRLSEKYNISTSSVNLIRSDKIWTHVTKNKTKGIQPLNNFRNNKFSLEEICDIYEQDGKNKDIANVYNVPESTIKSIRNGNSYKDITKNLKKGNNTNRLTKDEVKYIYLTDDSVKQIKNKISVSESTISGIKNNKSYKNITKYLNKENNNGLHKL